MDEGNGSKRSGIHVAIGYPTCAVSAGRAIYILYIDLATFFPAVHRGVAVVGELRKGRPAEFVAHTELEALANVCEAFARVEIKEA